jgi:predicted alpha/beta hydrolase
LPDPHRIAAALVVGSQSGYWKNWPPLGRAWMWPATHIGLPAVARLLGYFPAAPLGFGEDLPAGVALQWASWCRHPRYLVGAVRALFELYPSAKAELREVRPSELRVKSVGHFGFFRERFRDSLWREAADWLESR